jgi:cytochrome c553
MTPAVIAKLPKNLPRFLRFTAIIAIACTAFSAAQSHADSLVVRNCTWCHGGSAQGYMPGPRLAGQRSLYLEKQLANFRARTRDNPFSRQYMWNAAANLSTRSMRELAVYFSSLTPKAADDGNRELVPLGERIYQEGMPEANIVACVVCHGPGGEGADAIPRLAGLNAAYLKRRLEQWSQGYHAAAGPPMPSIAGKLAPEQIDALSAYLSFLR